MPKFKLNYATREGEKSERTVISSIHHLAAVAEFAEKYPSDIQFIEVHSLLGGFHRVTNPNWEEEKVISEKEQSESDEGTTTTPSDPIGPVIQASTQQKSLPYEPPLLAVLYKIVGWVILAGGIFSALSGSTKDGFASAVTLIIASLFIFGIAQVVDLIGKIEFNTRKPQK
ncbi:hypothetical protein OAE65_01055 [bacterium]|nr:hypothetical protein [bacterium]